MEKYGRLLEKAMQSQMHEEVPSDCEDWRVKRQQGNQSKVIQAPLTTNSKPTSSNKQQKNSKYDMITIIYI